MKKSEKSLLSLLEVHGRVANRLFGVEGVIAVGVGTERPGGALKLMVTLSKESQSARKEIKRLVKSEAPGTPVGFKVRNQAVPQ